MRADKATLTSTNNIDQKSRSILLNIGIKDIDFVPLHNINYLNINLDISKYNTVIISSINAIKCLVNCFNDSTRLITLSSRIAEHLRSQNYQNIQIFDNINKIAEHIKENTTKKYAYLCGTRVRKSSTDLFKQYENIDFFHCYSLSLITKNLKKIDYNQPIIANSEQAIEALTLLKIDSPLNLLVKSQYLKEYALKAFNIKPSVKVLEGL